MLVLAATLSLLFSIVSFVQPVGATEGDPHKETICHRTNSETNPYVIITVDYAAIDSVGNNDHMHHTGDNIVWYPGAKADGKKWGDIIPPVEGVTAGLNWSVEGQAIWNNGCQAGGGDAECIPAADFTDAELRDLLLGAGSNVGDPQDADGSSETTWPATVNVPEELCDVVVSFSSYELPGGFMQPFDEQVLFDNVTATYLGGTSSAISVDLPDCGWQVDLYIGDVIATLDASFGHPASKLIDWSANEGVACDEPEEPGTVDVVVEKSAEVDGQPITSIEIGESYDYVLTVTNTGDDTATGVELEDNLDDELTIDGITTTQGTCSITDAENNHIGCDLGDLGAGLSAVVTVSVTATIGAPGNPICRSPVDNVANVSADNESDEADNNNASNEVVVEIDCSGVGSIKIRKVDDEGNLLPGAIFTVEGQEGTFTTGEDGTFCITGLPFGEVLTVTEIEAPEGFEIVGDGTQEVTVDPDGDCDSAEAIFVNTPADEEEEESGTLEIRKITTPANSTESFAFMATYGDVAGFALSNNGVLAATELPVGDYSVWEVLTAAQVTAGWTLTSITCTVDAGAVIDLSTDKVTVTVDDGDAIVCTFANTLPGEGTQGGNPPGGGSGTQGGNPLPNTSMDTGTTGTVPASILALLMLGGLGAAAYAVKAEARRR